MTNPESPLVSIVTPTYNSARYLEDLLQSVAAQDYPEIEHIVIDDGSTDGGATIALLRRYPHVRWWSRDNRGQYPTLNEGFRAATGEFITTISADDTYADTRAIGAMARFLAEHSECDAVNGYTLHVDENGTPLPVQPYQAFPYWMLRYNLGFIFHCSLLVRRARLIENDLFFDESLRFTGDGDWMARLYEKKLRFGRIERHIGAYRHHGGQVTAIATSDQRASTLRREERARVDRKHGRSLILRRLVDAYDTLQQRRLKALGAWREGGGAQVWKVAQDWLRRKRDGE
jgi:glycosyltransferase involved in cell wall biosynthesis